MKFKLLLLLIAASATYGSTKKNIYRKVVSLGEKPWGIEFINPNIMVTTLAKGRYAIINIKSKKFVKYSFPLKVNSKAQGGLLDIERHPNFEKNNFLYFTYSKFLSKNQFATALARGKWNGKKIINIKDIYVARNHSDTPAHYGSRITFDDKGFLYMSVGERYTDKDKAQDTSLDFGKILRLKDNGSIPKDNPFKNAVWSYGHRNPQGLKWNKQAKKLIEIEHGPRGGDEINIIEKGINYGWPIVSMGKEYDEDKYIGVRHKKGMRDPVKYWVPSIAPCGLEIIGNKYYIGALALTHLNVLTVDKNLKPIKEERFLEKEAWRIRDVRLSPDKKLYIATDSGEVYQFSY